MTLKRQENELKHMILDLVSYKINITVVKGHY